MTTKFIGMKEFRQNMSKFSENAKKQNIKYIILKKNTPVFEVTPISEEDYAYIRMEKELQEGIEQIKRGECYTLNEVKQMLGLK